MSFYQNFRPCELQDVGFASAMFEFVQNEYTVQKLMSCGSPNYLENEANHIE